MEEVLFQVSFLQTGIAFGVTDWKSFLRLNPPSVLAVTAISAATVSLALYQNDMQNSINRTQFRSLLLVLAEFTYVSSKAIAFCHRNMIFFKISNRNSVAMYLVFVLPLCFILIDIIYMLQRLGLIHTEFQDVTLKFGFGFMFLGLFDLITHSYMAYSFSQLNQKLNVQMKDIYTIIPLFFASLFTILALIVAFGVHLPLEIFYFLFLIDLTFFNIANKHISERFSVPVIESIIQTTSIQSIQRSQLFNSSSSVGIQSR
jgi:hypothetical protein